MRARGSLAAAFERGSGHGLLLLGADEVGAALPPVLSYWREFGARYVTALCAQEETQCACLPRRRTKNWSAWRWRRRP
jgi:hypothetical protein